MKPFRRRAYATLQKLFQQRKFLISSGRAKSSLSIIQVEKMQEKFLLCVSDRQFSAFVALYDKQILQLPPAHHGKTIEELNQLIQEARTILTYYAR